WGDLLEQEPIELSGGVRVRVGIESRHAPLWSGVLVYCLAEGGQAFGRPQEDSLGPLRVLVQGGSSAPDAFSALNADHDSSRFHLFARSIPFCSMRSFELQLTSPDGKVRRCITLRASSEPFHSWMPLGRLPGFAFRLCNRADGIGLPCWCGRIPLSSSETAAGLAQPDRLLPSLFPQAEAPQIKLSMKGNRL